MSRKIKPSDAKNIPKIDQFFIKITSKRKLEDDENADTNDENKVETPSPSNSQQKRKFGEQKQGGLKPKEDAKEGGLKPKEGGLKPQDAERIPLRDKTPLKNKTVLSLTPAMKRQASEHSFEILTDEQIERGIERAPTPPTVKNASPYSSQVINSQDESKTKLSQLLPTQQDYSQWTASSPIPYEDSQVSSQALDEEVEFTIFRDEEDDDDEDDLFTATINTKVKFPNHSFGSFAGSLLCDDNEDSKSTGSFFSNHSQEEAEEDGFNNDLGFSTEDDGFTVPFVSSLGKTLSQEPQSLSQIILPDPNPRGNDILEKLKSNED